MNIRVRKMSLTDCIAVTRLHLNTIRKINARDYTAAQIKAWSGRIHVASLRERFQEEKRYVALNNKKIVGFFNLSKDGRTLQALYIHHAFLSKGVGTLLLKKAEELLRSAGVRHLRVEATYTARPFYEKQGLQFVKHDFVEIGGQRIPVCIMHKKLS